MSVEMIKAIAELTPLLITLSITILGFIFRKPLIRILENISEFRFKKGDMEGSLSLQKVESGEASKIEAIASSPIELTEENKEKQNEQKIIEQSLIEDNDDGSLFSQMWTAFYSQKDLNKAKELFEKLQNSTDNRKTKFLHEIWFWRLSYSHGDNSAIEKLQELSQNNEIAGIAHSFLGDCYKMTDDFQKAADEYELAAECNQSDEDKVKKVLPNLSCQTNKQNAKLKNI